jgi:hypothetical protein
MNFMSYAFYSLYQMKKWNRILLNNAYLWEVGQYREKSTTVSFHWFRSWLGYVLLGAVKFVLLDSVSICKLQVSFCLYLTGGTGPTHNNRSLTRDCCCLSSSSPSSHSLTLPLLMSPLRTHPKMQYDLTQV